MGIRVILVAAMLALNGCSAPTGSTVASPESAAVAHPQESPPMENGAYAMEGCEGEGACTTRIWRATTDTPMYSAQDPTSAVVGGVAEGEWVIPVAYVTRLVPPRGVVTVAGGDFAVGDVVYQIGYEGEGVITVWRHGAQTSVGAEDPVRFEWDAFVPPPQAVQYTLGQWIRARRERDGQEGWIHSEHYAFECTSNHDWTDDCRQ
jgi:hypothetical protein